MIRQYEEEFEFQCEGEGETFYMAGWMIETGDELHFETVEGRKVRCPNDPSTGMDPNEHDVSVTGAWA